MQYLMHNDVEDFRPRLILWQLTHDSGAQGNGNARPVLTPNERHLVLEGIARAAKPIVVLTGDQLPQRSDVRELIQYGIALGLKMIIETRPEDLTADIMRQYSSFGRKIFRLIINTAVAPGVDTRFDPSKEFTTLEETIRMLRSGGFEIHLSVSIDHPDIRRLAVQHDYAFRRSANGFYCHLAIEDTAAGEHGSVSEDEVDAYIDAVANLRQYCPNNMYYLSPQCVKYGYRHVGDMPMDAAELSEDGATHEWQHWCLGGKTFAFITEDGIVKVCSQLPVDEGDLRKHGFDFQKIWESSETFRLLRSGTHTCSRTREILKAAMERQTQRNPG